MRDLRRGVFCSVVVAVLLALVVTMPSTTFAGNVTSSLMLPVDGLVFTPGHGFENVTLSGRVHLVTQTPGDPCTPTDPCRLFVNLADVKGVGVLSGADYIAIGAVNLPFTSPTPPPILPQFLIMPVAVPNPPPITPPNPIMPITFQIDLLLDETGHLVTNGTSVSVPPNPIDQP